MDPVAAAAVFRFDAHQPEGKRPKLSLNWDRCLCHGTSSVVIKSPDSDVAVIALSASHQIDTQLIFRIGMQHCTQYLNLTAVGRVLGKQVCSALPGFHAFTGCDSTSAFSERGKVSGFKLLKEDESFRCAMTGIGQSFNISAEQLACQRRTGNLYPIW